MVKKNTGGVNILDNIKTNGTGLQYLLTMTIAYVLFWRTWYYGFSGNGIESVSGWGFWLHKYIMMTPWSLHLGGLIIVIIYGSVNYPHLKNKQFIFLLTLFISCGLFGEAMNTLVLKRIISRENGAFNPELWTRQFGEKAGKSRGKSPKTLGCSTHVKPQYISNSNTDNLQKGLPSGHSQIWGLVATMITLYTLGNETQDWIKYITIPFVWILALLVMAQRNYISCHKFIQITSGCTFGIFYGILFYMAGHDIAKDYFGFDDGKPLTSSNIKIPSIITPIHNAINKVDTREIKSVIYGVIFLLITISLYNCLRLTNKMCGKKSCNGIFPAFIFLIFVLILVVIISGIVYLVNNIGNPGGTS